MHTNTSIVGVTKRPAGCYAIHGENLVWENSQNLANRVLFVKPIISDVN